MKSKNQRSNNPNYFYIQNGIMICGIIKYSQQRRTLLFISITPNNKIKFSKNSKLICLKSLNLN